MTARTQEHAPGAVVLEYVSILDAGDWHRFKNAPESSEAIADMHDLLAVRDDLLAVLEQVRDFWAGGDAPEALENAIHAAIARAKGENK